MSTDGDQTSKHQEELELAETRLRAEIARHRDREQAQLKALRVGCFTIVGLTMIGMALAFFF